MENNLNMMVSVNSGFFRYLVVMLTSVYVNNSDFNINIYLLYSKLKEEELAILKKHAKEYHAELIPVKINEKQFENYPVVSIWSIETYFRLLAAEVLPRQIERILYLDVDIIVDGSLRELYETDFEGKYFVVCEDNQGFIKAADQNKKWNRDSKLKYFNAGVLLYNLAKLRQEFSFERFDLYARQLDYCLAYLDQELLNYIFGDKVKYVNHEKFNKMIRYGEQGVQAYKKNKTVIYHYAADNKPWGAKYLNPFFRIWWDYAEKTPFFDEFRNEFFENCYKELDKELNSQDVFRRYYNLCLKWMNSDFQTGYLKEFFRKNHFEVIAIYGMGELGKILLKQLMQQGLYVKYAIDKIPDLVNINKEIPVFSPEEDLPSADVIVITPVVHTREIKKSLSQKGSFSLCSLEEIFN